MQPGQRPKTGNYRGGLRNLTLGDRCRDLRQASTDAEAVLWRHVRGRQLAGAKFRRQHQFGPYILDFYCAERNFAVEVDGGQHYSPEGESKDAARTRYLEARGVRVVRFSNLDVLRETTAVVEEILRLVSERPAEPSP
jgi:very-short-patch-repair endonuclease